MKQKKKNHGIKNQLSDALMELSFGLAVIGIALLIGILFPSDQKIPFEILCFFAALILGIVISAVILIFHIKKKKDINAYFIGKTEPYTLFDRTLKELLCGSLKISLECLGLTSIQTHVDLSENCKCIDIQGKCGSYYLNAQLTETELAIGYDDIEPDPETVYPINAETPDGFLLIKIRECISAK